MLPLSKPLYIVEIHSVLFRCLASYESYKCNNLRQREKEGERERERGERERKREREKERKRETSPNF